MRLMLCPILFVTVLSVPRSADGRPSLFGRFRAPTTTTSAPPPQTGTALRPLRPLQALAPDSGNVQPVHVHMPHLAYVAVPLTAQEAALEAASIAAQQQQQQQQQFVQQQPHSVQNIPSPAPAPMQADEPGENLETAQSTNQFGYGRQVGGLGTGVGYHGYGNGALGGNGYRGYGWYSANNGGSYMSRYGDANDGYGGVQGRYGAVVGGWRG